MKRSEIRDQSCQAAPPSRIALRSMRATQNGSTAMVKLNAAALRDFVRDIFVAAGCSRAEAERIGRYLVAANLAGHDSHGVIRVPRYVQLKKDGVIVADRN